MVGGAALATGGAGEAWVGEAAGTETGVGVGSGGGTDGVAVRVAVVAEVEVAAGGSGAEVSFTGGSVLL